MFITFCRNKQFAVVENPGFWNWTFTLKDIDGKVLAQIDRDWRGFGFEVILLLPFFSWLSFYCYLPQDTWIRMVLLLQEKHFISLSWSWLCLLSKLNYIAFFGQWYLRSNSAFLAVLLSHFPHIQLKILCVSSAALSYFSSSLSVDDWKNILRNGLLQIWNDM